VTTYGYDGRGNRTTTIVAGGPTTTYGYDQANRLKSIGGGSSTYAYNGNGLRMSKTIAGTTTQFAWDLVDGTPLILQEATTSYITGPGGLPLESIDPAGNTSWYFHDQLGSTRALTDSTGTVAGTATYDDYGQLTAIAGVSSPFGFAGEY